MTKLTFLHEIDFKRSPTVRDSIRDDVVDQYAAHYQERRPMPPVVVFYTEPGKPFLLADGSHRCAALMKIGRKAVEAEIHKGGYEAALQYALQANCAHGLPRSSADKRKSISVALMQWPTESSASIAKRCDVDDHTVADVRKELERAKIIKPSETRISSRGATVPAKRVTKSAPRISEVGEPSPEKEKAEEPKAITDKNGTIIPKAVLQYWKRSDEAVILLNQITEVMNSLKQADREKDLLFAECNITAAISDLEKVRMVIRCAEPFAVCTQCAGHPECQPKGECRLCLGRGLISKFRWERLVPEEVRKMITKGVAK